MSRLRPIRPLIPFVMALAAAVTVVTAAGPASAWQSLQRVQLQGPSGEVIEAGVWTPDDPAGGPRPLVVISHGNGGHFLGHQDTAEALARAGFVVAALTHPGDNSLDMSRSLRLTDRAPQVSALISFMTEAWPGRAGVDASRIGAFGFSAGGFTVATLAGGESDAQAILDHCAAHPDFFVCSFILPEGLDLAGWKPAGRDDRIRAAVMAAPGFGFAFDAASLDEVRIPLQLWQAGEDQVLPAPFHVEPLRDRLPGDPEYRLVPGALHHDFLVPCEAEMRAAVPELCRSNPGFDRAAFKQAFNAALVAFFVRELGEPGR
ncbi:dienelactone hydrolase [Brevundimonas sp.]|uniref:alpha/beta hydrolase family protein n=1 Tax=Brevundimonas sp. TaxID=1871086 RepID=UPI002D5EF194|nr:dienelactone hydrolase [Brevundimonas sp.]HYC67437.1 dienelactone hydrolase [Brevundimonas sp.]